MWIYRGLPLHTIPPGAYGFTYEITNTLTGQRYLGKKAFYFKKTTRKKGERRKTSKMVESDWRRYTGSSTPLNADIERLGIDSFTFEILTMCDSKRELTYQETRLLFVHDVLRAKQPDGSWAFYNECILHKFWKHAEPDQDDEDDE